MLDVGDEDAVALAELAGLGVEVELRHEEQRQPLGAGAGALGAGQHQVHDVLARSSASPEVMKRFTPSMCQRAVGLLDGLGAAGADVGAGVGLGEHHGGAPAALGGEHGPLLLLFGAEVVQDLREAGAHEYMYTAGLAPSTCSMQRPLHRARHRHATELLVEADLVPATVDERAHGLLEAPRAASRCGSRVEDRGLRSASANDSATGPSASLAISRASPDGVGVQIAVLALAERLVDAENLEQVEYLVTDVALVVAHDSSSMRMPPAVGYFR